MPQHQDSFHVVVLSCGDLGIEVANDLRTLPGVTHVTLVTAPYNRKPLTFIRKLKQIYRTQGWFGYVAVAIEKVKRFLPQSFRSVAAPVSNLRLDPLVTHLAFEDFHASECIGALRSFKPDLGVVAGTYMLKKEVFDIPQLGSINLHSGKAPEYRGAAPGFWELFNGESSVGITVHRVASELDAGSILLQELFPLDSAPALDPLEYLDVYRREVLRPNGVRMIRQAVAGIRENSIRDQRQDPSKARTYRSPDYAAICELRHRVWRRREERGL